MNDLESTLRGVLAGDGAAAGAVLHNCRFDGAGSSVYGREAILDQFRSHPMALDNPRLVAGRRFAALFGSTGSGPVALFADVCNQNITRIRFLGPHLLSRQRPIRVDVPHDAALTQLAAASAFDLADHPELLPQHAARVLRTAQRFSERRDAQDAELLRHSAKLVRLRPFVLRAFSSGRETAILFIVSALRTDGRAGLLQFGVAAWVPSDAPHDTVVTVDEADCEAALAREWRPTL